MGVRVVAILQLLLLFLAGAFVAVLAAGVLVLLGWLVSRVLIAAGA